MCLETLPAGWHDQVGTPHNFLVCVFTSCPVVNISTIRVKSHCVFRLCLRLMPLFVKLLQDICTSTIKPCFSFLLLCVKICVVCDITRHRFTHCLKLFSLVFLGNACLTEGTNGNPCITTVDFLCEHSVKWINHYFNINPLSPSPSLPRLIGVRRYVRALYEYYAYA